MSTALLVIDPQKDFLDDPSFPGALAVSGAFEDMKRLAAHIEKSPPEAIVVTVDTHAKWDIAHPMWWVDANGNNPNPFTLITVADVESGKWKASDPKEQEYSEFYVKELAKNNRYVLCVWPYHCIDGTEGHKVTEVVAQAISSWEQKTGKAAIYVYKGKNPRTEHYSGLKAEVVLEDDPETELNVTTISYLTQFNKIEVAGEAKSHCVASTARDLIDAIGDRAKDVIILEDCMSNVTGFEAEGEKFIQYAKDKGCEIKKVASTSPKPR